MQWAQKQKGFTIVELLIVVVVIAILAAITIVSYNGISARANDAHIQSDIDTVAKSLESFYAINGYYPSVADMLSSTFRTTTLGLPDSAVTAPGSNNQISYCWSNSPRQYCYVGNPGPNGSFDCGAAGEHCVGYRMSYRLNTDPGTMVTRRSLN